jgi:hypothetical protein
MFRPRVIRKPGQQKTAFHMETEMKETQTVETMTDARQELLLRRPRSAAYVDAMQKLDTGGAEGSSALVQQIKAILDKEFSELSLFDQMLGCVSICHLGGSYEVHTLDHAHQIITHYKTGETLPDGLEKARNLAMYGGFVCVEVYKDCCRGIYEDGTVSVIKG